jgi:two-component system, cell cycle sensor histidine kinase and response regulator CckA
MNDDHGKTEQQLIEELTAIRRRVDELETLAKEHRQAEEKLRQSEAKYRLLTEKMNDSIWTADLELRLTYVSPSDERLFGFTAEERMAQGLGDMLTPASQEKALEILSREWALEEKGQADPHRNVFMELEYYRKDGSTIWVETIVSGIRNDEGIPIGFHGVDRDITERRKSQQTLRESEEKYRRLAESAHEFIVTVDLNFKITYVNRAVLHATKGMDPVGMSLLHFTPPHLHELQEAIMQKRREGFSDIMSFEWEINLPTGKAATFDIRAALLTEDGKPSEVMFVARDVSERKRIEKALQESEERFRRLAESARDCIWTTDMNLRYTYVSPYIKEGLGYTPEEYMTIPLHETLTPASLDTCMKLLAEELEIEKREDKDLLRSRTVALEQIHKDGHIVWVEIKMTFLRNDAGQAIGILGYTRDITERRKAEEVLRASEAKYRFLTHKMNDVVWTMDMGLRLDYVSPSVEKVIGFSPEEHLSRDMGEQLTPASISIIQDRLAAELALEKEGQADPDRTLKLELEYYHKDGSTRWLENVISGIRDDQGVLSGIHGVARDITERKKIMETLRQTEERFATAFKNNPAWLAIVHLQTHKHLEVNDAWEKLMGYTRAEAIDYTPVELGILDQDTWRKIIEEVLANKSVKNKEAISRSKNGESLTFLVSREIVNIEGEPYLLSMGLDITEHKRAEAEKERLKEQLERARKLESIGTLAGGIAHDFNNLLMGIQGHASLMMLDIDPSYPHHVRLKHIEELVQSGADLTRQLLGFARGGRYAVKPADMNEIVEKTSAMFGRTRKEITIHRKYGKDLWTAEADRSQMEQVFMNLYVNAWHAMPGGGEIDLETVNYTVPDEGPLSLPPGRYVKITITDTGTGMDASTLERIFDPFFTTKKMGRGTGLGLATVYGIIKGHGGMIDVSSEPGQGTTFDIYLPATEKTIIRSESAEKKVHRGTETILLVDDERMVLEVAREMLQFLGYRVHGAGSGQEAVAMYREKRNQISLVVLDMIMPGMSGSEAFDHLRGIDPGIKVLLSSGYSIDGEAQAIMNRGCNGFLQKPFQLEQLARKVRAALAPEEEQTDGF